jgi:hypothetical protein
MNRRSIQWELPKEALSTQLERLKHARILRHPRVQSAEHILRTPHSLLEFKLQGSQHSIDFQPVNTDSDLLSGFERRTERVVGDDEKAAIQDALSTGYSLEFGYWGRTIRVPIRGEASSAAFKA